MANQRSTYEFMEYLASGEKDEGASDPDRIPALSKISEQMGVSISSLREQLEVAKALGFVEVRPRTGTRRLPYSFTPSVHGSLSYAIALDPSYFATFSDLRKAVEAAYVIQAAKSLTTEDIVKLEDLIESAWEKLRGDPIRLPHREHRELHLTLFTNLENPFVLGILEAYWNAYEDVGLNRYAGLDYLEEVWRYHQSMVEAIRSGDFETGRQILVDHFDLMSQRPDQAG
ncbi:MAG: FadR family transcriptional regulator [Chloroflexi bacterium]|nr:FadR family transcriptional regulator [Chloroflexota bacterium]